jgi:hypothetical protein
MKLHLDIQYGPPLPLGCPAPTGRLVSTWLSQNLRPHPPRRNAFPDQLAAFLVLSGAQVAGTAPRTMISLIPLGILFAFILRIWLVHAELAASCKGITMISLLFAPLPRIRLIHGKKIKGIKRIMLRRKGAGDHLRAAPTTTNCRLASANGHLTRPSPASG